MYFLEILEYETSLWGSVEEEEEDHLSCTLLLLFFRALLQLCPALKRVRVTLLAETDAVSFVVHTGDLERLVRRSGPCLHIEHLFFLGCQAVISDRKPVSQCSLPVSLC